LNAVIVEKRFGECLKILKDQKARNFFALSAVIAHGRIRIGDAEKMHLIG